MNTRLWGIGATVLTLHLLGWGGLLLATSTMGSAAGITLATGLTAYVLGLRHAFDADHIAAIDSATRTFAARKPQPVSIGLLFSLGHSTVVFVLVLLLVLGLRVVVGPLGDDDSMLHLITGTIGPLVSGCFLILIAWINAVGLRHSVRDARTNVMPTPQGALTPRGPLYGFLRSTVEAVGRPWHMYPVGLLFGLGFDTATEIGLLSLAGGAALATSSWYAVLCLPVLFAAGMTALDSADGVLMARLYRWSLDWPAGRNLVNITMTGLTVALAASIGLVELLALLGDWLGWTGWFWTFLDGIDMQWLGVWSVALFAAAWIWARAAYRRLRAASPAVVGR